VPRVVLSLPVCAERIGAACGALVLAAAPLAADAVCAAAGVVSSVDILK